MRSRISDAGRLRQKRGNGIGKDYVPWIQVQDFSSSGLSSRIKGRKTKRVHHLLSQLESTVFHILDLSPSIVDIREQYPLFPLAKTISIASSLGLKHPTDKGKQLIMTTDFVIQLRDKCIALNVKHYDDLTDRTVEKIAIERQYWASQSIDFNLITEKEIPGILLNNSLSLRDSLSRPDCNIKDAEFLFVLKAVGTANHCSLETLLKSISVNYKLSIQMLKALFFYLVSKNKIVFDLTLYPFELMPSEYEIRL